MCSVSKFLLKLKTLMKTWKLERTVDRELDLFNFLRKLNGQNTYLMDRITTYYLHNSTCRLYFLSLNFINFLKSKS